MRTFVGLTLALAFSVVVACGGGSKPSADEPAPTPAIAATDDAGETDAGIPTLADASGGVVEDAAQGNGGDYQSGQCSRNAQDDLATPLPGGDPCRFCAETKCCTEVVACSSGMCRDYGECSTQCSRLAKQGALSYSHCIEGCDRSYAGGKPDLDAFHACIDMGCSAACK